MNSSHGNDAFVAEKCLLQGYAMSGNAFDPEGIAEGSQGLSAAIPLATALDVNAPRRGARGMSAVFEIVLAPRRGADVAPSLSGGLRFAATTGYRL